MSSISFVTAVEEMKYSRGMKHIRIARYKQTRKDRNAISKDNTIGKMLMERDSQRHKTQEKHHEITIQTKSEAPKINKITTQFPLTNTSETNTYECVCECCSCSC